jgi:two-component system cell cycle response regulator DivK
MAPHDGFALLKMIRCHDEFRDVAVVALTASVMSEEVRKLKTAGFDGVVGKPIKQQTFPELLNRILHGEQVWYVS